jgi:hypothetical protein
MAKGLCSNPKCLIVLTGENSPPSVFRKGYGWCLGCSRKDHARLYKQNPEKIKAQAASFRRRHPIRVRAQEQSISGRHSNLRTILRKEKILKTDLLWSFHFYEALIVDQRCHYCLGLIGVSFGHGLDRMDSSIGHTCYNVLPCCRPCNTRKMHDLSYEEMMLLAPILRQIRLSKV